MARKKNNNLVKLTIGNNVTYYTSQTKAGLKVGLAAASVIYAIEHKSILKSNNDEEIKFEIIDGSKITWDKINND